MVGRWTQVVAGATANTLVLSQAEVGKAITARASYIDGYGTAESVSSTATAGVKALALQFVGTAGADQMVGTSAGDRLVGLAGNDTYWVNHVGDTVVESAGQGNDRVQASISYTLAANLEDLTLTGVVAITGTGNELNNVLKANDAGNTLIGAAGNDTLQGGAGADTLMGGVGADMMMGGGGDDSYDVDNSGDKVTEMTGKGTDVVRSSITYALGANVENLTLTGAAAINGTGNELNNTMVANDAGNTLFGSLGNDTLRGGLGADMLLGGAGPDQMAGGAGNDTYGVDDVGDKVSELVGEGIDLVNASVNYTLGVNVENLALVATTAKQGTGNELNNIITANDGGNTLSGEAGNDILRGGKGADILLGGLGFDQMVGGAGNDVYDVDSAGDTVTELVNQGTDSVKASISYALGANVENLTMTGSAPISGVGNELNNTLTANDVGNTLAGEGGDDTLVGGKGADTLLGGAGNDILNGGLGNDLYRFGSGSGADAISDVDGSIGNSDSLSIGPGISANQIWLRRVGSNLEVSVIGSKDKTTILNWYLGNAHHIEQFSTSDGKALLHSRVDALVSAMAAFKVPVSGQVTLPANYQTALNPVIAANWK
jgi:Ca2+-binding RTX toxin-like protein